MKEDSPTRNYEFDFSTPLFITGSKIWLAMACQLLIDKLFHFPFYIFGMFFKKFK